MCTNTIRIACGVVGIASYLSIIEVVSLAALVYAGASQFIICALLVANSPIAGIILTTFTVKLRNFLLSATWAPNFKKGSLPQNLRIRISVTDESFGVESSRLIKGKHLNDKWINELNIW